MAIVNSARDYVSNLTCIELGRLRIPHDLYQRPLNEKHARRIGEEWDWAIYDPIRIAKHEDGAFNVCEGQHRVEGARIAGITHLPAIRVDGGLSIEAHHFVEAQRARRSLTPGERYRADIIARVPYAIAIEAALADHGFRHTQSSSGPGSIQNVGTYIGIYRYWGEAALRLALYWVRESWDSASGVKSPLAYALGLVAHKSADVHLFSPEKVTGYLKAKDAEDHVEDAVRFARTLGQSSQREAMAYLIMRFYNARKKRDSTTRFNIDD